MTGSTSTTKMRCAFAIRPPVAGLPGYEMMNKLVELPGRNYGISHEKQSDVGFGVRKSLFFDQMKICRPNEGCVKLSPMSEKTIALIDAEIIRVEQASTLIAANRKGPG